MEKISASQAAQLLGISIDKLAVLEKQGLIHVTHTTTGANFYSREEISRINSRHGLTIAEEAAQVNIGIQRDVVSSVTSTRKILLFAGSALAGYVLLVLLFTVLFIVNPVQTAKFLGIVKTSTGAITQVNQDTKPHLTVRQVLAATTSLGQASNLPTQTILQPIGQVSLGLVKNISPTSYAQVAKVAILDANDVLVLDNTGALIPVVPLKIPSSSLEVANQELVINLNSQYVQGKQPGTNPGDIAIVSDTQPSGVVTDISISELTNTNLSGSAGITNANLENSAIIIDTLGPLSGGGSLSLGETLTLSCPTCIVSGGSPFTANSIDTLTNKTLLAGSNTISGLTNSNLSGTAGITNANLTNSALTVTAGSGLTGGGAISLGSSATLDIGAGNGITVNTNDVAVALTSSGTTGETSSNSSLEVSGTGLTLLHGCTDGQLLKWTDAGGWACASDLTGSDLQHAASYDTEEAMTNIPTGGAQITLGTISVIPTSATGDVYVTGWADVYSSNGADQPLNLVIETTSNCTGSIVGNASVTYTITSGASAGNDRGTIRISGIAVDAGASAHPYSLCAAISSGSGDTDVLNWGIEAIVIDTGADLAEIYTTNDASIDVGDVVSIDPNLQTGMKKSQVAYDQTVLGIVSTRPGLVIGDVSKEGVNALPIALSGRVPVRVSAQNGSIAVGDYLTTSSIPGVAMKATKAGAIIGTALSAFDGEGIGQILAFVKNGSSIGSGLDYGNDDLDALMYLINEPNTQPIENVSLLSEVSEKTDNAIKTNLQSYITQIISDVFNNTITFFGNVIFHADVTFLGRPIFNKDTAGHAFIKAGSNEVIVIFEKEYTQSPVVTASINMVGAVKPGDVPKYAIYDLSTKGFIIKLSQAVNFDLNFSWIALSVNENTMTVSGVSEISEIEAETVIPSTPITSEALTPSPSQEIVLTPTVAESASSSAQQSP